MKKLSTIIGLVLLLQNTSAHAQTSPSTTPPVINQQYLTPILERIDTGLERASHAQPATNFAYLFLSWLHELQSAIVGSIDTENRIVLHAQDLINFTPCLHYDLLILEKKIDEVNDAMKLALAQKRVGDILLLKDLLGYVNTRYNHLVRGATDPGFEDEDYYTLHAFDENIWCCQPPEDTMQCAHTTRTECKEQGGRPFGSWEQCSQICQAPLPAPEQSAVCAFHTDYLPPASGFGCDAEALAAIPTPISPSFPIEKEALRIFEERRDNFLQEHANTIGTADSMLEIAGREPNTYANIRTGTSMQHIKISGCTAAINEQIGGKASLPEGAARIALRGPFSLSIDQISIVRLLEGLLRERGGDREQDNSLKYPSEFAAGSQERADAEIREQGLPPWVKYLRELARKYFAQKSIEQAGKDALPISQSIDVQQRVADEFAILRAPIRELGRLASTKDAGMRKFAKNYASFMQKSCVFRPCTALLQRVLKIIDQDECFPYTNGPYKEGTSFIDCALE